MNRKMGRDSKSILGIISSCGGGDWPPLLVLAEGLRDRGHRVRFYVIPGQRRRSGPRGYRPYVCRTASLDPIQKAIRRVGLLLL